MTSARRLLMILFAIACGALLASSVTAGEADIGAAVFHGETNVGVAVLTGGVEAPASRFACATCHGRDGLGGQEGAYRVPAIQWRILAAETSDRPGYDAASLARLLQSGIDTGGREISTLMPRYRLGNDELSGVADYLQRIETESRTGVQARSVSFTIDYDDGQLEAARAIQESLNGALGRIGNPNLFGRSLRFEVHAVKSGSSGGLASVMTPIANRQYLSAAAKARLPVVAPLHALAGDEDPRNARSLFAARAEQMKWLSDQAPPDAPVVTLAGREDDAFGRRKRVDPAAWAAAPTSSAILPDGLDAAPAPTATMRTPVNIFTTVDGSGRTLQGWLDAGANVTLADPRAANTDAQRRADLDRLADATVRAIVLALENSGRDVTRARFMAAFDGVAFTLPDWPAVDFSSKRLTGASAIGKLELKGR